jgi:maleylpyruvate isomerase
MILHGYYRSSAAYRVRIALAFKGVSHAHSPINLQRSEQRDAANVARNPQGLVPVLETDEGTFIQSLSILEYLEERHHSPALLPVERPARAHVREMAALVACDVHPLNNLRVLQRLRTEYGFSEPAVRSWISGWIGAGLAALEALVLRHGSTGEYCWGSEVTLADVCLVPQIYSARRFKVPLDAFPVLLSICENLETLPAFICAKPENQPDAPQQDCAPGP